MTTGIATALILGVLVSTAYGALFHLIMGGNFRQLTNYILASWVGFIVGQFLGQAIGFEAFKLGTVHLATATIGSCLLLAVTRGLEQRPVPVVEAPPSDPFHL